MHYPLLVGWRLQLLFCLRYNHIPKKALSESLNKRIHGWREKTPAIELVGIVIRRQDTNHGHVALTRHENDSEPARHWMTLQLNAASI